MRLEFSLIHKPLSLYRKVIDAAQNLSDIFIQSEHAFSVKDADSRLYLPSISLRHP